MALRVRNPKRRRLVIVLVVLILIGATVYLIGDHPISTGPAEGTELFGSPATRPASRLLRVATFNIDSGVGIDGKLDLARTAKSLPKIDFIGMNEVHGFVFAKPENQAEELSPLLHLPGLYVPAEKRWGHETFGNAIFSDLPVKHWQRVVLPSEPFRAKRNYLLTEVEWQNKTLSIITTHTDWKNGGVRQFEIVRDLFLSLPTPAILMGDLNTPPSDPLIIQLKATKGVEEAIDQKFEKIDGRVDWIFLRGLTTVDASPADTKASDHPAYWAQVELK